MECLVEIVINLSDFDLDSNCSDAPLASLQIQHKVKTQRGKLCRKRERDFTGFGQPN